MHYSGCEKSWVNGLVLWFIHILKTVHVQQLKGMQSSKLGMWKEYRCQEKVYEGVPFLSKMVYKRVWGWTLRRGLPVWNFVEKLGSFNLCWIPKDALLLYKTRWNYVNKISTAFFFFALDGKFPEVGTFELSNPPGWGRKKRTNAPSSVNTATFFIDRTVK